MPPQAKPAAQSPVSAAPASKAALPIAEPVAAARTRESDLKDRAEFQKLTDSVARKAYWKSHPSLREIYAESNFH